MIATVVIVAIAVGIRVMATRSWPLWDLDVYIAGARAVTDHRDLYAVSAHGLLFTYPPFAAITFVPLAVLEGAAGWLLTLLSIVALVLVVAVIARELRLSRSATALLLVAAVVLEPVTRTLVLGQINLVLMAVVVVDLFVMPRRARGLLIGIAAGVKLTPAVFVIYFLVKRDYRAAAQSLAGFVVTVLLGWVVAPDASVTYWSGRALALTSFGDFQVQSANQSLRAGLIRVLGLPDPPVLLWALLAVAALVVGAWVCRMRVAAGDDVGAVLALAAAGLLASPISWTHHWVWVVIGIMYAAGHRRYVVAWLLGLVFYVAPMWFLPAGALVELRYDVWQVVVSVTYVLVGAVGLLLLASGRGKVRGVGHR